MTASPVRLTLVLDGYNVLKRGFGLGAFDLESQRGMMETQLREFLRRRRDLLLVLVYDGALMAGPPPGTGRREDPGERLEILFSTPPGNADQLVLDEARRRDTRGPVLVVTSDRKDIVSELHGTSIRHLSSEEFVTALEEVILGGGRGALSAGGISPGARDRFAAPEEDDETEDTTAPSEKPEQLDPDEVSEWMIVFSDEPPDEGLADPFEVDEEERAREESGAGGKAGSSASGSPGDETPALPPGEVEKWLELFSQPLEDDERDGPRSSRGRR